MSTRIVLVRHGESNNNVDGTIAGVKTCTGLSPLGREQAQRLCDRLVAEQFQADAVLASTITRAVETAGVLAEGLGQAPILRAELGEIEPGESDGEPWEIWGPYFLELLATNRDLPIAPGGETINDFRDRAAAALLKIANDYPGQTVLVVTHGGVVIGSMARLLGEEPDFEPENTSLTEWNVDSDRWQLTRFNDVTHLSPR